MIRFIFVLLAAATVQCTSIPNTAEPVQLLNIDSGNKSDILYNGEAIKNLFLDPKLADRDVVVFSIIGAFRKGKSFLMNYVLRYMYANYKSVSNANLVNPDNWMGEDNEPLTGFSWKAGTQRVTTGLILWSDVFLYDGPKGEKVAIYLMDTQGLFDHKSTSNDNSRIFSLSTMISSTQILNLLNIVQEDQLQYLQFATEYARYASAEDEKSPFQNLMILIRDWNSPEEFKFGSRGGKAYLNQFLEIHDYQTRELQSVRRYIRSSFEKVDCFLMPHPGKTVARVSSYDGRVSEIDDDFLQGMNDLFHTLLSPKKLALKKINGAHLKPADLLIFINDYVEKFKNDSMPEATNVYESTLEKQFRIAIARSVDIYLETVASHNIELTGEDDINKLHVAAKDKALKFFNNEKKFGTYSEGANFKRELQNKIEEVFQQWKKVSMNHLRHLNVQKDKTIAQQNAVQDAHALDVQAKHAMEEAIRKAEEAKKALEQARYDTAEAKKEAEELAKASRQAEIDRAEAIEKEKQTKEWLEKMTKDKEYFEQEYNNYKRDAMNQVGATLINSQQESGLSSVLGQITSFFTSAVPFISAIGGLFG